MSRRRRYHHHYRIKTFNPTNLVNQTTHQKTKSKYQSKHQFTDFAIPDQLKRNILNRGFKNPTPIQDQAIKPILRGKDLVGSAHTGTGKTAAFLIPLVTNLSQDRSKNVLIMTPTRELAIQIRKEVKIFSQGMNLHSTLCIGGTSIKRQISSLKRQPDFIIGTPGRLIDLTKRRKLKLHKFPVVVLDEVDRMLDMGFINDMKYMIGRLPKNRQSLFFSATLPHKLNDIIHRFVRNPIRIEIKSQQQAPDVNQDIVKLKGRSKTAVLHSLLNQSGFDKVLVFGRTKHGLNKLQKRLDKKGHRTEIIHGNKSQNQRKRALRKFKRNQVSILLATDVASRGLDIDDITHVINYDLPESKEVYIHRIGRTGRANKTGTALSFVA
ncbi:MAG: DEAD/DEAH box helicase [Patescibacteria group bacterium]|nr:DEAD/DEAH box helicase [Patescibacteria group bacterium]